MPMSQGVPDAGPDDRRNRVVLHQQHGVVAHVRDALLKRGPLIGVMHHAENVHQQLSLALGHLDHVAAGELLNPRAAVWARVLIIPGCPGRT